MNPSLFSADGLVGLIFLLTIAITIAGGMIACNAERLVRAVAGLIICFIGVGALYYFLNSPFVAMMQVLIYVGAVAVTISFAIMLAAPEERDNVGLISILSGPFGFITAAILTIGLCLLALKTPWISEPKINDGSVQVIGTQLLTNYSMVFELVSIVLLIAIIGALVIAREGRKS
ncbi:MAG: NADH-quinone oxidoreductase subunit J [Desulfopila sp.]